MQEDFRKSFEFIIHPERAFERESSDMSYWPMLRFYLVLNILLAVLTPVVNWFHIPSDIVHAGTNAQMGAYVQAPLLEASTGISRYFWVAVLTYAGNLLKFPLLGVLFHGFSKIMHGTGTLNDSFKIAIYSTAPVLLMGWVPFFGLISGLWVGYLYVVGFWKLHNVSMGKAIALVNLLIGIQLVWAFVFGWIGSSVPW
ncbi:MAG: YIP1 family protein [Candidatus Thorarchaeota archaeon]